MFHGLLNIVCTFPKEKKHLCISCGLGQSILACLEAIVHNNDKLAIQGGTCVRVVVLSWTAARYMHHQVSVVEVLFPLGVVLGIFLVTVVESLFKTALRPCGDTGSATPLSVWHVSR